MELEPLMEHYNALLLIGPTSAGKTPLGAYLQTHGINSTACHHFDFGAHLRRIGAGTWRPHLLDNEDIVVVEKALATGALLEDQQFHIARHVLRSFAEDLKISDDNPSCAQRLAAPCRPSPRYSGSSASTDTRPFARYTGDGLPTHPDGRRRRSRCKNGR
jgi:hypothetical protein